MALGAIDGELLMERLNGVADLESRTTAVFDASTEAAMNDAIRVLRAASYTPREIAMVEQEFYMVEFMPEWEAYPYMDHWPYWVRLRFMTIGSSSLPLALAHRTGTGYERYTGSYRQTYGTKTSDAEKMLYHFAADHPGLEPVWVPLFAGEPALF